MSIYRKPLAHGGARLIERGAGGRFARTQLDCFICSACGQIVMREFVNPEPNAAGFRDPRQAFPKNCPKCQKAITEKI